MVVHNQCGGHENQCFEDNIFSWYGHILSSLFYSQGFIFTLTRILEPGAFRLHMSLAKKMFGFGADESVEDKIEPINLHFNSTLNIEFVYVILEGIVKFSHIDNDDMEDADLDFSYSED